MSDLTALLYRERCLYTKNRTNFFLGLGSSFIYIVLFGSSITRLVPPVRYDGVTVRYLDFAVPALLVFSMVSGASMAGTSLFQERAGRMDVELWSCPVRPACHVVAKVLAGLGWVLAQALIALVVVRLLFHPDWPAVRLPAFVAGLVAAAAALSGGYLLMASRIRDFRRFNLTMNVLGPVLLFASDSFYPSSSMPLPLRWVGDVDPFSYAIKAVRNSVLAGSQTSAWLTSAMLLAFALVCWGLVTRSLAGSARTA